MPIEEISTALAGGSGPGTGISPPGYLQLYMAYARSVSERNVDKQAHLLDLLKRQGPPVQSQGSPESPFEEEVLEVLEKRGCNVRCQIGESGFRIDLAVL